MYRGDGSLDLRPYGVEGLPTGFVPDLNHIGKDSESFPQASRSLAEKSAHSRSPDVLSVGGPSALDALDAQRSA